MDSTLAIRVETSPAEPVARLVRAEPVPRQLKLFLAVALANGPFLGRIP
jgi:hypothetical protein